MTNHWRDIRHADLILINGANPAEAHPVGFQWFMQAKIDPKRGPGQGGGAKMVHADPRFTRTSAVSDIYARIRTGTDVAYFGGLINYVLSHNLIHHEYVKNYTNASFLVKEGYGFHEGLFSGYDPAKRSYDTATWAYEGDQAATAAFERTQKEIAAHGQGPPTNAGPATSITKRDPRLEHPRSVFQLMKAHYSRYTPEVVSDITGIPTEQFLEICKLVGEMGRPDKVMTIVYAVGLTHHTTGGQLIRSAALLQLLLGNMGRPGGGMNAERGHANIQGNTDHAISWEILPGYLRIPAPGQKNLNDYVQQSAPKKFDANWSISGNPRQPRAGPGKLPAAVGRDEVRPVQDRRHAHGGRARRRDHHVQHAAVPRLRAPTDPAGSLTRSGRNVREVRPDPVVGQVPNR